MLAEKALSKSQVEVIHDKTFSSFRKMSPTDPTVGASTQRLSKVMTLGESLGS